VTPPTVLAKIFLFDQQDSVLTLTRSAHMSNRPFGIDIPGGHVDGDETYEEAVRREVYEETGINQDSYNLNLIYVHTEYIHDKNIIRFTYAGKLTADVSVTLSHEHTAYEWLPLDDPRLQEIPEGYRNGLEHAHQYNLLPA